MAENGAYGRKLGERLCSDTASVLVSRTLRRAQTPLSAIALACGCADQSHFTRVFTNLVGISPGA